MLFKIKNIIIGSVLFLFVFISSLSAQNVVPNGSFEEYESCPQRVKQNDKSYTITKNWTCPTIDGTTDYFNACTNVSYVDVPTNFAGKANAKEGKGYIGFTLKNKGKGKINYREYAQAKLKHPLKKGQKYCVALYYRLADCSVISIDRLGVYFSPTRVQANTGSVLHMFKPQIQTKAGQFMDNDKEWKPLRQVFTAAGNEKYIIIGNFYADQNTGEKPHGVTYTKCGTKKKLAYYYIDKVEILDLCQKSACFPDPLTVDIKKANCFNGGSDLTANISGGAKPYKILGWDKKSNKTAKYKYALTGTHFFRVKDANGCIAGDTVTYDCGLPLSAKFGKCSYNKGNDGIINVLVRGGKKPYKFVWNDGTTTQNRKNVSWGTHSYVLTDAQGVVWKDKITFIEPVSVTADTHYVQDNDGYINLKPKGGVKPYTYKWNDNVTTQNRKNLSWGKYQCTVTDSENRTATIKVRLIKPLEVEEETYFNDTNDGFIKLKIDGGTPPYKIKWSNGARKQDIFNLRAGTYKYEVRDSKSWIIKDEITFIEPIIVEVDSIGFDFERDGYVLLKIRGGCKPYQIKWSNGKKGKYVSTLDNGLYRYTVTGDCDKKASDTVRIQGKIILKNINFKTGSTKLLESSFSELDRIVKYMNRRSDKRIKISGHTDNVGADRYNETLSKGRAKSVVAYLVKKGIKEDRLEYEGYGERKPIADNKTKEGREKNRRVEFELLK